MNRQTGIVAMLDILGYSTLIDNNDVGENMDRVLDLINSLPKQKIAEEISKAKMFPYKDPKAKGNISKILDSLSFLVFSDTILITLPIDPRKDLTYRGASWGLGLLFLSKLFKSFMDYGLPLRGGVSYGEYLTKKYSFAGKPIVNAYRIGNELDSSGILIDDYAAAEMIKYVSQNELWHKLFPAHILKTKSRNGAEEERLFVSPILMYDHPEREKLIDTHELTVYLTSAFTAYSKGLSISGRRKLDNTIFLFRQCLAKSQSSMQDENEQEKPAGV